ncbi:putative 1-phosphatidylinositol-3-phosphate 5-kinase FAB1C [Vitis vinifera]|uniref:Putative 1-phosphatidylinositol-3-phosphate 5-kinase FAB1C n=1 Tax=Vitis vinifera TaxID=29760 RepID=A0A438C1F0_VITVI|nr:putative 1-phosphatidylinositol-3-phosphate 5-kinase FAB1C [Vitis vinifera]
MDVASMLRCAQIDGVPPATRRVFMSDAAWDFLLESSWSLAFQTMQLLIVLQLVVILYKGTASVSMGSTRVDKKRASELLSKIETVYVKISDVLDRIEQKTTSFRNESSDKSELHNHIMDLKDLLNRERNDYNNLLQPSGVGASPSGQVAVDILELNCLRRSLLIGSHGEASHAEMKGCSTDSFLMNSKLDHYHEENVTQSSKIQDSHRNDMLLEHKEEINPSLFEPQVPENSMLTSGHDNRKEEAYVDEKNKTLLESIPSPASNLSDKIDLHDRHRSTSDETSVCSYATCRWEPGCKSSGKNPERIAPSSLHLSTLRSFHASGDYRNMVRDPVSSVMRTYSQLSPREAQKVGSTSSFFSSSHVAEGARLLLPQTGHGNLVIAVYDNEPTSIISYALSSKKYETGFFISSGDPVYRHQKSPHLRISFGDESSNAGGKVKFSVTCYFAKQFDTLRKKCCPNEVDFVRSLSRCKRWSAQGGKSNVYFAKSLDERFIIKQVTKTELVSFEKFAHEYFKYLTHSLSSGSPTCLAKILGHCQNLKGERKQKWIYGDGEPFFKRNISRVYDLKVLHDVATMQIQPGRTKYC